MSQSAFCVKMQGVQGLRAGELTGKVAIPQGGASGLKEVSADWECPFISDKSALSLGV